MSFEVQNKEEFTEVQKKLLENNRVRDQTAAKIQANERAKRRNELTVRELEQIPSNTRVYKSVGKMFLLTPNDNLKTEIKDRLSRIDSELGSLQKQHEYLDKQVAESEKQLKEIMVQNYIRQQRMK